MSNTWTNNLRNCPKCNEPIAFSEIQNKIHGNHKCTMKPLKTKDGLEFWVLPKSTKIFFSGNNITLSSLTEDQAHSIAPKGIYETNHSATEWFYIQIDQALKDNGYAGLRMGDYGRYDPEHTEAYSLENTKEAKAIKKMIPPEQIIVRI